MSTQSGQLINNRYELVRTISADSFASVWDGQDQRLVRPVAIKIAGGETLTNETLLDQFRQEALISARLSHPNIVAGFDAGTLIDGDRSVPFFVMERIFGLTLRELMLTHPFTADQIRLIGRQLASAIGYAHTQGVVHGDIKPTNVLIIGEVSTNDLRAVLGDFGLAMPIVSTEGRTHIGGTAPYAAPELFTGALPNAQTDMYSLGALLYELAANTPPFLEETEAATIAARKTRDALPVRSLRPDLEDDLARIIDKCVATNPDDRYSSFAKLEQALERHITAEVQLTAEFTTPTKGTPRTKTPRGTKARKNRSPMPFVVGAIFLTLVGLLFYAVSNFPAFRTASPQAPLTVPITSVEVFDPLGDKHENDAQLPRLTDGDPQTTWSTNLYKTSAFGGLKSGIGLVLSLSPSELQEVALQNVSNGTAISLYLSQAQPQELDDWGKPVTTGVAENNKLNLTFSSTKASLVLLWITDLGSARRASIGEITLRN